MASPLALPIRSSRDRLSKGGNIAIPIIYGQKLFFMILEKSLQLNYPLTSNFKSQYIN